MPTLGGIVLVDPVSGEPYKAATAAEVASQMADPSSELGAALSSTCARAIPSVGERLRRASAAALTRNAIMLGTSTTPPAITSSATNLDATLTKSYPVTTSLALYRITGGVGQLGGGAWTSLAVAPVVSMPSGTGGNTSGVGSKNSYQWAVEFMTDAPKVMIRHSFSNPVVLEVDDQPLSDTAASYPAGYILLDFTSVGGSKHRKIRIETQQSGGFWGIYVGPTYTIWTPTSPTNLRVCTAGDSVDANTNTAMPGGGWQKIAGKLLGWTDVRQVSFGGSGYVVAGSYNTIGSALRVADVAGHNPDLLILQASQNDEGQAGAQAAALATYQAYRAALPSVPIVCVGPVAGSSGPSANRLTLEATIKAAFDQWADPNSWWIPCSADPAGSWETGTGTSSAPSGTGNRDRYASTDSAHPNTAGHVNLGQRFANAFRAVVLPYVK